MVLIFQEGTNKGAKFKMDRRSAQGKLMNLQRITGGLPGFQS